MSDSTGEQFAGVFSPDGRSAQAASPCSGHDRSPSSDTDTGALESPHHGRVRQQDHPHQRHDPWRAGCGGSRTSGSEGGPEKPTDRKTGRALRPDPYTYVKTHTGWVYAAFIIDVFSRMVVGWQLSHSLSLDAPSDPGEVTAAS
jgi:transposase InsO family protein